MFKYPIFYLMLLVINFAFCQKFTLVGTVLDEEQASLPYANVILTEQGGSSTFLKGTICNENGVFELENIKKGTYRLKVSIICYKEYTTTISILEDTKLASIILKEDIQSLDSVTLVAKRPKISRKIDRLVFNIENTAISNDNILEVLKHAPGIFVNNGTIKVKTSTPVIYINNKKVHLSLEEVQQLLEGTSASNVKEIEVITNPPVEYEAEGSAVINIVTSKNIITGYNGSVYGKYAQGYKYPKYNLGTSHFFKTKKWNTYLNYGFSPKKEFRHNNENVKFSEHTSETYWKTNYERTKKFQIHNFNANVDYQISENDNLGFTTSMLVAPKSNNLTNIGSVTDVFNNSHVLDSLFDTKINGDKETVSRSFTLDFNHDFNEEGEKLRLSLHHTNYDNNSFQDVNTDYFYPNDGAAFRKNRFQTHFDQKIKLVTGSIDYNKPINELEDFKLGTKISNIKTINDLDQFSIRNGVALYNIDNSDIFRYNETNYAIYSSYSKNWGNWSFQGGLRIEHTNTISNALTNQKKIKNNYTKFFPTLYILNNINDANKWYFNYNRRIRRPRYAELNPFKYYLNDNSFIKGDPKLKPEIDDVFTLGYTLKDTYTFEVYYRYENNPTLQVMFQDNNKNIIQYINTNIKSSVSYGLDFTTYTSINNLWSVYALSSIYYYKNNFVALESNNINCENDRWSLYAQMINYLTFLEDQSLITDVSLVYMSPYYDGPSLTSSRFGLDINLKKTFWNNKASLSMGVTDIFNTQNFSQTTKYLNQDVYLKSKLENRLFILRFNYKFGNY
ncbi:MAG: TonB-dependent receptor domain-containing protein, partial [Aestuariibaculum sp.]